MTKEHELDVELSFLELITEYEIDDLKEGEWIWDNKLVVKREHGRKLWPEDIMEPYGFRQIHIARIPCIYYLTPQLMLSDHDRGGYRWEYFEEGRFYRFKYMNVESEE